MRAINAGRYGAAATLRVGENAIIVVTCGDSRLDNRKVKEALGGKGHMNAGIRGL